MDKLGYRIREERRRRHLTLAQFSEGSGLSKGFLSQIERDLAQPSISSLKRIARQLEISVVDLFAPKPDSQGGQVDSKPESKYCNDIRVVLSDRRKSLVLPGSTLRYDLLTPDLNRQLQVLYVRAAPGDHSGDEPIVDPPGDKFGLILSGTVKVVINEEVFQLEAGDSIYHPAHAPHSWCAIGDDPVEIIWILTPPSF